MYSREINRHEGTLYGIIQPSTIKQHKRTKTQTSATGHVTEEFQWYSSI